MRFISMVGSKQRPVPKKQVILKKQTLPKKEEKKELLITGIETSFKNEQLHLKIVGENIDEKINYDWTITFDNKVITPSSIGSLLILSKSNTIKYIQADKTKVIVKVENYTSPTFTV